jgi:hypothetical protein
MSVLPALVGLRHEDHESETSLGFIVRLSQKQNKKNPNNNNKNKTHIAVPLPHIS